jgi:hypothetical protein
MLKTYTLLLFILNVKITGVWILESDNHTPALFNVRNSFNVKYFGTLKNRGP